MSIAEESHARFRSDVLNRIDVQQQMVEKEREVSKASDTKMERTECELGWVKDVELRVATCMLLSNVEDGAVGQPPDSPTFPTTYPTFLAAQRRRRFSLLHRISCYSRRRPINNLPFPSRRANTGPEPTFMLLRGSGLGGTSAFRFRIDDSRQYQKSFSEPHSHYILI